jgi:hypothetical protein
MADRASGNAARRWAARERDHLARSKSSERVNDDAAADVELVAAATM